MAIVCTRKFNWPTPEGAAMIYFPGQVIEDQDAATFARMTGHAEERGVQAPSRIQPQRSPEDKKADLGKAGGETKAERKAREKAEREAERQARGVKADEGEKDPAETTEG